MNLGVSWMAAGLVTRKPGEGTRAELRWERWASPAPGGTGPAMSLPAGPQEKHPRNTFYIVLCYL